MCLRWMLEMMLGPVSKWVVAWKYLVCAVVLLIPSVYTLRNASQLLRNFLPKP